MHSQSNGNEGLNAACSEELSFTAKEWKAKSEKEQQEILMNYRIAYLGETMVNWCPQLGTVLANDEVVDGVSERGGFPVIQKKMRQWCLRVSAYAQRLLDGLDTIDWTESLKETQKNWIGRSEGAEIEFKVKDSDLEFTIFTTRADTMFGVTFMVLAPESELVQQLTTDTQKDEVNAYLERTKNISSTKLRSEGVIFNMGIVTDDIRDNDFVEESKYVSGVHVERVFSEDHETAQRFCDKYELGSCWNSYDEFLADVDIVYIKTSLNRRAEYIERALKKGKYVISDSPMTLSSEKLRYLFQVARENNVVLIERTTLVYLRAFNQLVWLVHSNLVGDLVSVKCAISQDDFEGGRTFNETVCTAICAVLKLLGKKCQDINTNAVRNQEGRFVYDMISMKYAGALATIEIGTTVDIENELVIIGSNGRVTIPNDWWNTGYFEANISGKEFLKRYSFNFEGNGFRYLLQELMIMIRDKRTECTRLFYDESVRIIEILETINRKDNS